MTDRISRRRLLRRGAALAAFLAAAGGIPAARSAWQLAEQRQTWAEASRPNAAFFARHALDLRRLTLGGSFAPEQWPLTPDGQQRARRALEVAVRDLGMRRLRLGLRWNRVAPAGTIDLSPYAPLIADCLAAGVEICLNVGPIRVFRWPEEHIPPALLQSLPLPETGARLQRESPLAEAALDHLARLLDALRREFSDAPTMLQVENEPFFALGPHRWRLDEDYLAAASHLAAAAFPRASLLVTSAGRLNLEEIRHLFQRLLREDPALAGRLVSGFDFHYKTPLRDSFPLVRHFDQVAYAGLFAPSPTRHVWDSRDLGFKIEVSEAQAEPYGHFESPGNSARDFRFLLLRCLDSVLDPLQPALIRIWGLERLTERLLSGDATEEHQGIVAIIRHVNQVAPAPRISR